MQSSLFWLIVISIIWLVSIKPKEKEIIQKEPIPPKSITSTSKNIIDVAKENLGKPYVYGKEGPDSFDCSGFVYAMHKELGIQLPRTSLNQSKIKGEKIPKNLLKEGDLVFFDTAKEGHVNHSGIYLGEGKFIHATSGKAYSVTISSLEAWYKDKFKWGKRLNANK
ncbi:MAG: Cell wall-associated hydrolase [uncultured Sulfurovum sp.]|uniref:Cell wall-associated hydrolase n=1 Tax=uncultured Sulfurovum sp. TaxID=269237 RepID=A0A6S6SY04_9BACT|nr:MAG: Cell wall-associated hydrolase [uncultured Sulfurovum sp.]